MTYSRSDTPLIVDKPRSAAQQRVRAAAEQGRADFAEWQANTTARLAAQAEEH